MSILAYIKQVLGITLETHDFDPELLDLINGFVVFLFQLGVDEYEDLIVDSNTEWPTFAHGHEIENLSRRYLVTVVQAAFDPTASATVQQMRENLKSEIEHRLDVAVSELADVE